MNKLSRREKFVGISAISLAAIGGGALAASAADSKPELRVPAVTALCNGNILGDVCTPGLTVPPDVDPVVGNPQPGQTIPVSPTNPAKGEDSTTSSSTTSTTEVVDTTSTSSTVPGSTTSTTVTSSTSTLPPITIVVQPTVPAHSN